MEAEVGYTCLYLLKIAVEKANRLVGGWPDDEAIISQLEGLGWESPAGYIHIRPDNHQGYKDAVTGFSKNVAEYQFPIWDPEADHHDPNPQHHGACELAQARHQP